MKIFTALFFSLLLYPAFSQEYLRDIDMSSFYQDGKELTVNSLMWEKDRMIIQYRSPRAENLEVALVSYESYSKKKSESETVISSLCEGETCRFDLDLSGLQEGFIHILRFTDVNTQESYITEIQPNKETKVPLIITNAFDDILLDRSFLKGSEVYVKGLGGNTDIYIYHYSESFQPAEPPTGIRNLPSKDLAPLRQFRISSGDQLLLDQTGLYFLQTDPNSNTGYSFRVENSPYPNYNSLDDLKACMIYISTADEWESLVNSRGKTEFDQIWLERAGNENNARTAIRNYYRQVNLANKLFTTFKEGWKTDKGIILIIFGTPSKVSLDYNIETWEYDFEFKGKKLQFEFEDRANIFSPYHSTLERKQEYRGVWNMTIENLRRGIEF